MSAELLKRLEQLEPAELSGLALLLRLQNQTPTTDELLQLQAQLEQAVSELEDLAYKSRRISERCKQLKAKWSPRVPTGF